MTPLILTARRALALLETNNPELSQGILKPMLKMASVGDPYYMPCMFALNWLDLGEQNRAMGVLKGALDDGKH